MKKFRIFRGDTFFRKIVSEHYKFKIGDKLHIAILKSAYSKEYIHEEMIEIKKETNEVILEIFPEITSTLPIRNLMLEIELTTIDGMVKTNQYGLEVEADGIYERN